ncbi:MAG: hypothetical protein KGL39_16305 [Patescibacteria group bacterium]|nr:hypothetical protein [Patescibacteria group bacterium]
MAAPSINVSFTAGQTTLTLRATKPDTQAPTTVPGVVHRTQGGSLVSYQVGPQYFETTLQITGMSGQQKDALVSFFAANFTKSWTYTDENGNAFTAQFLDISLPISKNMKESWDCNLHLNLSAMLK